jgi:hypothetical protein
MTHDNLRPFERDAALARGLDAALAPPGGEGYWDGLEARIMARIATASAEAEWWTVLARWERPALVAAAVLMLAAGVALVREQWTEANEPYWAMATSAPVEPVGRAATAVAGNQGDREATLQFLLER